MNTFQQRGSIIYGNSHHLEQLADSAFALAESRRDILADGDRTPYGREAVKTCEAHIVNIANTLIRSL